MLLNGVTSMIELSKEALTEDLINGKPNNQLIAVYIKIRNNKLYFSTPASYDTRYRDLIIINPNEYTIELYDLKRYLKILFTPALINDTDLKEIRSYLTHMTGKYSNLKRVLKNNDIDPISKRIMIEEMKEKAELKKHYKVIGAESHD